MECRLEYWSNNPDWGAAVGFEHLLSPDEEGGKGGSAVWNETEVRHSRKSRLRSAYPSGAVIKEEELTAE